MALGDILAARADNARARGTVEVGALGTVEVEALPIRELERLWYGIDRDRVVFYAACRALQREGAALLRAGKVYRPDEVMALVSDAEAAKAAEAVRALSGWTGTETKGGAAEVLPAESADRNSAGAGEAADTGGRFDDAELSEKAASGQKVTLDTGAEENMTQTTDGQVSREFEIRPDPVRGMTEVRHQTVQENAEECEVRRDTVRENETAFEKIRRSSVQSENGNGQVSREFLTENAGAGNRESKTQVLPENAADAPLNVGVPDESDTGLPESGVSFSEESTGHGNGKTTDLHEIESESGVEMHEIRSETAQSVHESESDFSAEEAGTMHEMKSDLGAERGEEPHEMKSEVTENVHETTSELAERVARELLDGLKRAAWVR